MKRRTFPLIPCYLPGECKVVSKEINATGQMALIAAATEGMLNQKHRPACITYELKGVEKSAWSLPSDDDACGVRLKHRDRELR
jgi:hypothetical protein